MKPKPLIKFNGGNPVALCNRCFTIMCYIECTEEGENCVVTKIKMESITTPIGEAPPSYCTKCNELLTYSINE